MDITTYIVFVFIGVLIAQLVGALWYSKLLFKKIWMRAVNKDEMLLEMEMKKNALKILGVTILGWVVATFFVLTYALQVPYLSVLGAITHALCMTFAFAGATALSAYMYENKSLVAWAVFYGYVAVVVIMQLTLFTTLL